MAAGRLVTTSRGIQHRRAACNATHTSGTVHPGIQLPEQLMIYRYGQLSPVIKRRVKHVRGEVLR